jgi:aryl-alcohol dehydrogenase-like predicted oxidoreductase
VHVHVRPVRPGGRDREHRHDSRGARRRRHGARHWRLLRGHNELLLGRALRDRREKAVISVKFGALRGPDGSWIGMDTRPVAVKNFFGYSLKRLGVDYIDIYRPGRLDPDVPIEDTVAIGELVKASYVRAIGLSEVGPETIRRTHAVHPLSDLQRYSLVSRSPDTRIVPVLTELGIGVTAYGVLSRGLLSGSKPKSPRDFRRTFHASPVKVFSGNERLVETLRQLATEKDATAPQLAIAWVLAKAPTIVPLVGARTRTQLAESLEALQVTLTAADVERIEATRPPTAVAGTRYDEHQMRVLDRER